MAYLLSAGALVTALAVQGHLGASLSFASADEVRGLPDARPERDPLDAATRHAPPDEGGHDPATSGLRPGWSDHLEVE